MRTSGELGAAELRTAAMTGLMALVGRADGPPLAPPPGLVAGLERLAGSVTRWSAEAGDTVAVDWPDIVTVRARLSGLRRQGTVSAGGTCRLLEGPDGFMAVNLARPEDRAAVDAMVEADTGSGPWAALERALEHRSVAELLSRARLLGIPAAPLGRGSGNGTTRPWSATRLWPAAARRHVADLRVVDLSAMWAGPLAAMLLSRCGAHVVKVESTSRPDGARGQPAFYDTLHPGGQELITLDLGTADGHRRLRALLAEADVVIESSRPRALEQLGAGPGDVEGRAGRTWVSITGYGRAAPGRDWVAFGDDAAVAGGLVAWEDEGHPVFCGDALADPVTGMVAAAAALEAIAGGGGLLLDVPMHACASSVAPDRPSVSAPAERNAGRWTVEVDGSAVPVHDRAGESQPAR